MAGGIQNIDMETVKFELHGGRGNRNAALLFDFHPVRGGVAFGAARLYAARLADGAAVEQ